VHRQKIRRVVKLRDQPQLMVKLPRYGIRHAVGIGARGAVPGQRFQRLLRRLPGNPHLGRILVAQRIERKLAPLDNLQRPSDGVRMPRKQPRNLFRRFQMPVRKTLAPEAGVVDRAALADARHHVL